MNPHTSCVIVGAGHAGVQCALSVRKEGWEGNIILISNEAALPYHRPPLSKAYLSEDPETLRLALRPEAMYEKQQIQLLRDLSVESIDREAHSLNLSNGESLSYSKLVLATGAKHRVPPVSGIDGAGIYFLRTVADADALRSAVKKGIRVAIVGAGYIGLELASSLRKLGCDVVLIEMEDRIMARVTTPEMSGFFHDMHSQEGVEIITGIRVARIEDTDSGKRLITQDGVKIDANIIIMGTGALPNSDLAEAAGLDIDDGILVDGSCTTSDSDIYAIGDCARQHHPRYGKTIRLESVQNALDQGKTAALAITEKEIPLRPIPWFWSDQYDVKFQIAGLSTGHTSTVVRGTMSEGRSFSVWYFKDKELLAVDAVNDAAAYVAGSKFLADQLPISPDEVSDPDVNLKALLAERKAAG